MVGVQLGLLADAGRLYQSCGRWDLLNRLYRASGEWDKAVAVAEEHDRIHLKATHYEVRHHGTWMLWDWVGFVACVSHQNDIDMMQGNAKCRQLCMRFRRVPSFVEMVLCLVYAFRGLRAWSLLRCSVVTACSTPNTWRALVTMPALCVSTSCPTPTASRCADMVLLLCSVASLCRHCSELYAGASHAV